MLFLVQVWWLCMQMIVKPRGSFNIHAIMNRFKMMRITWCPGVG